jgi:hypothetical protein
LTRIISKQEERSPWSIRIINKLVVPLRPPLQMLLLRVPTQRLR